MTTLLFSLTTKNIDFETLIHNLKTSLYYKQLNIIFVCEKSNKIVKEFESTKEKNIQVFTYPTGTSEECMIESTLSAIDNTRFVLVRNDCEFFSIEKLDDMLAQSLMGADVIMFQSNQKQNFFKKIFNKTMQKLCDVFFNFKFYDGDIGMQFFSEQAHSLMKYTEATILTKINRWVALNVVYIPTKIKKTVIKGKNLEHNSIKALIYSLVFLFGLAGTITLSFFVKIHFLVWLIIVCGLVAFISMSFYYLLNFYTVKQYGNLRTKKIDYISILKKGK